MGGARGYLCKFFGDYPFQRYRNLSYSYISLVSIHWQYRINSNSTPKL